MQERRNEAITLLVLTVLIVAFHLFMEWLFFVTKPSFLSTMPVADKVSILVRAIAPLAVPCALGATAILVASNLLNSRFLAGPGRLLALLLPAVALATAALILVDNFTLTIFGYGIRNSGKWVHWLYGLVALLFVVGSYRLLHARVLAGPWTRRWRLATALAAGLVGVSMAFGVATAVREGPGAGTGKSENEAGPSAPPMHNPPNVLLIASDGLDATHMGAYGYPRDTTPTISRLVPEALVVENAFSNSAQTGASIASLLTGKLPTETHLIFPPDILQGADSFEHLPGILARHGYRNVDVSVRNFADAYDLNLRGGFEAANGRRWEEYQLPRWSTRILGESAYFAEVVFDRVLGRFLHITGIRPMPDPFAEVQGDHGFGESLERGWGRAVYQDDLVRLKVLTAFIDSVRTPFFAHIQLFGTHGPAFANPRQVFSAGKDQTEVWMQDFYDDAVLQFDTHFRSILQYLESRGRLDNTLIVIHSDHGQQWQTGARIPLIFRFPRGEHAGRIKVNAQNLDIAPTILDYLGIEVPSWMRGQSLLSDAIDPLRPILCPRMYVAWEMKEYRSGERWEYPPSRDTPFEGLEVMTVVVCNRAYRLHLNTNALDSAPVRQHTAPCAENQLPSNEQVRQLVLEHLRSNGYATATLER